VTDVKRGSTVVKRKALVIGNPGEPGAENYCDGVNRDCENYPGFLTRPLGGAWERREVEVLVRPTVVQVRAALSGLKAVDYAMVIFAGHGYSTSRGDTILELRRGEEIDSSDLRAGASKQTLVLDCCRKVARELVMKHLVEAMEKRAAVFNRTDCRKFYDAQIERCAAGISVMWGCTVGEEAGDDPRNGGYYARGLLEGAVAWADGSNVDTSNSVERLSIVRAHELAAERVKRLSGGRQNPIIEKPRTDKYFPFAIIA